MGILIMAQCSPKLNPEITMTPLVNTVSIFPMALSKSCPTLPVPLVMSLMSNTKAKPPTQKPPPTNPPPNPLTSPPLTQLLTSLPLPQFTNLPPNLTTLPQFTNLPPTLPPLPQFTTNLPPLTTMPLSTTPHPLTNPPPRNTLSPPSLKQHPPQKRLLRHPQKRLPPLKKPLHPLKHQLLLKRPEDDFSKLIKVWHLERSSKLLQH